MLHYKKKKKWSERVFVSQLPVYIDWLRICLNKTTGNTVFSMISRGLWKRHNFSSLCQYLSAWNIRWYFDFKEKQNESHSCCKFERHPQLIKKQQQQQKQKQK